jgi:ubiquinone/menaquinone biosynthesis C-methylase UbiE
VNIPKYDDISTWYEKLRSDESLSLVDNLIFPYIYSLLNPIKPAYVCDLACGQGKLSRLLAQRGARVLGVDISINLLNIAQEYEKTKSLGVTYLHDDAESLSKINDNEFDGVICHMALMDIPNLESTFASVSRVLKTSGWFAFSITHPCFESPHAKWEEISDGRIKRNVFEYFEDRFWLSKSPNGIRGQVGAHHRKLSTYINLLVQTGFTVTQMIEPKGTKDEINLVPGLEVVPTFMMLQAKKSRKAVRSLIL